MRSFYSLDEDQHTPSDKKQANSSASESNEDDDRGDDMDEAFEQLLSNVFLDNPASPFRLDDDIIAGVPGETLSDVLSGDPTMALDQVLLLDSDLLLAPDAPDIIDSAADAAVDLGQLWDGLMKPEPCSPPSPDGSDSGVESYSVGFEYCDTPPVTPPQLTVSAAPGTIIQFIKQESAPRRSLSQDTPQGICLGTRITDIPHKLPIPALPRTNSKKTALIRPAPSVVLPKTVTPKSVAATYIITTPAIQPRPAAAVHSAKLCRPLASVDVPKARPLPAQVTVPPTRAAMDARALKRQERMIKNRMSACLSRIKKKDQFAEMEVRTRRLEVDNERLRDENQLLHRQVAQLTAEVDMLRQSQAPASPPPSPRRPLMLLSVLLLAGLNLAPLGSLFKSPLSGVSELKVGRAASPGARTLLWAYTDDQASLHYLADVLNTSSGYMCPKHVNQTEARRLSRVLHGWFDAAPARPENNTAPGTGGPASRSTATSPRASRRRPRPLRKRHSPRPGELQLYQPDPTFGVYASLLAAIRRRDDTFYVVSFNGDHLMLPALSHNQTQRPRMSLLLPSPPLNESMRAPEHYVAMMQIDCEVVNTKLLHIHQSAVPAAPSAATNAFRNPNQNFDFPAAPVDGFPLNSAIAWNGSTSAEKRWRGRKHPTRKAPAASVKPATATNSTGDAWRKLRFGNHSVDGSGGDTTFRPPQEGVKTQHREAGALPQQRLRRRLRAPADTPLPEADYFQSEH